MYRADILRRVRGEEGSILVTVMVILVALSILGFGVLNMSDSQTHMAAYQRGSSEALNTAEMGMEKAMWYLNTNGNLSTVPGITGTGASDNPYTFTAVPSTGKEYTVKGTIPGATRPYWEIRVRGRRTVGNREQRIIAANIFTLSLWDFTFSNNNMAGAGGKLRGEVSVHGPFYVKELLELTGNSDITGGPLMVKKTGDTVDTRGDLIMMNNTCNVGTPSDPILVCVEGSISGYSNRVFADPLMDWVPDYQFPTLTDSDMQDYKNNQATFVYPRDFNGGSDVPGDLTLLQTDIPLKTGTSPTGDSCTMQYRYDAASGVGTLSLHNTTNPAKGVIVYVCGRINFGLNNNKQDVLYDGRGTLISEGVVGSPSSNSAIYISKKVKPADMSRFPTEQVLGLITPQSIVMDTQHDPTATEANPDGAGAYYGKGGIEISAGMYYRGAVVSDQLRFSNNPQLYPEMQLSGNLPPGMPGAGDRITYFARWREATTF